MKRPSYRYELLVEYQDTKGKQGSFMAQESSKQDAFLLVAKMVGFYQARYSRILNVKVQNLREGYDVPLPRGLTSLWF